jgi:hypothetical protein
VCATVKMPVVLDICMPWLLLCTTPQILGSRKIIPTLQKELSKQRWLLNLVIAVETHHQKVIMDLSDERVRVCLLDLSMTGSLLNSYDWRLCKHSQFPQARTALLGKPNSSMFSKCRTGWN